MKKLGLYLHIPFCIRKCFYCDFCSYPGKGNDAMAVYVRELCRRLREFAPRAKGYEVDTVYFGGGTPTLLSASCMEELMTAIRESYALLPDAEITCECNPASIGKEGLAAFCSLGINRLSIGLQSAHDGELKALGRVHDFKDFCRTYEDARLVGFDNISVDLMYGIPNQTLASFGASLDTVFGMEPEHLSSYGLKIEEGTRFDAVRDTLLLPDEDTEFEMYRMLCDRAEETGLSHYEISNFAKVGRESRHNLRYWRGEDYVGFGVAAYSCFEDERFGNSRDLAAFLRGEDITAERELLGTEDLREEYIMLRLRLGEGLSCEDYANRFGEDFMASHPAANRFLEGGFLKKAEDRIAFTTKGFFVSNSILSELI